MSSSIRILLGLGLGLITGILYTLSETESFRQLPGLIEPIGTLWVNAIRMTVIPLLMALMITAIAGQKSTSIVAQLGGKTIGLFVLMVAASSFYVLIVAPPLVAMLEIDPAASASLLQSTQAAEAANTELPPFSEWLTSLIPTNPVRAAADNAILPLMIFTGLFAIALLRISEAERSTIIQFFVGIKDAIYVMIGWIMKLAPVGVFALVFPLAATLGVDAITALASFIVIAASLVTAMMLALYPLATIVGRLRFKDFVRAVAPVQVIGFSTRSSLASLPATIAATEILGISARVSGVVLPIAVTLFKFASPIARTAGTYFVASLYGIDLSIYEMFIIAMAIGLFSFYSPGIPSGGLLIMTPVYVSLGLPVEGIGILIAIDLIVDMFITAANVTANVTAAALLSRADRAK